MGRRMTSLEDPLPRPDDDEIQLARLLEAIANPTRLALLRQLRRAQLLGEIRIRAEQAREGLPNERPMARQGVRLHLDRLIEAGFARGRPSWRGEIPVEEYVVQHQRLFALSEDIRELGDLRPLEATVGPETAEIGGTREVRLPRGRALVIVHGLAEGRAFPLHEPATERLIGRLPGLAASLDYDPFVSSLHARVFRENDRVLVENVPGSRNGTLVNWTRLKNGAAEPLRHGDIISVGKSLLLFRE